MNPNLLAELIEQTADERAEIIAGMHAARIAMQVRIASSVQARIGMPTESAYTVAGQSLDGFIHALEKLLIRNGADRADVPQLVHEALARETAREALAGQVSDWIVATKQSMDFQAKRELDYIATEPSLHKV